MTRTSLALLLCASALVPVQATAQDSRGDKVSARLEAMQAEIARLSAEVERLKAEATAKAAQDTARTVPAPAAVASAAPAGSATPAPAAAAPAAAVSAAPKIAFKGAPEITAPGGWSFKPRGRINIDFGTFNAPDSTGREDGFGSELRRARLGVEGTIPGGFGYKFEYDFAPGEGLNDAVLTYKTGNLTLTAGQHNNFQGMEELSSSRFTPMIERAAFTDAFGFERRLGVSAQVAAGDLTLQGGVFSDNVASLPGKSWGADGRIVYAPDLGGTRLHLGASVHHYDTAGASVRYRQRPLVHFTAERFVNTGTITAEAEFGAGLEGIVISGPFHFAAEGFWQSVERPGSLADPTFFGGYAEAGLFLTRGDGMGYRNTMWDRVRPKTPLGDGGAGALQLVVRYDHLDLNDAGIVGGMQRGYLASLVWTPTDYTRFLVNYGHLVYSDAAYPAAGNDRSYAVDSLGMRMQVDF